MPVSGSPSRSCIAVHVSIGHLAVGVLAEHAAGEGVDLGLRLGVAEAGGRRLGAVHAEGVLGDEAAVGGDEAEGAGVLAQPAGHRGDRVHDVVVPRAAGEGQPAGDGERAVGAEAELVRRRSRTADGKQE